MSPGCAGRYCLRKSLKRRSPIKQMPVESVFFGGGGRRVVARVATNLRFVQFAHRKQRPGDLLAAHRVQEVALILVRIQALEQLAAAVQVAAANVVAGGDEVGTQHQCVIE